MKRLVLSVAFVLFSVSVFGATPGVVDCRGQFANVIALESPGSVNVVAFLECNQNLSVIGTDMGWTEVQINGRTGFVEARYIRLLAVKPARVSTRVETDFHPTESKWSFGVKGGLNLANLSNLENDFIDSSDIPVRSSVKMRPAFNAGAFVEYKFNEVFGISPEFIYSRQGATIELNVNEEHDLDGYTYKFAATYETKFEYDYFKVPVLAKVYVTEALSIDFGPQFGVLLSAKQKEAWSEHDYLTAPDGEILINESVSDQSETNLKRVRIDDGITKSVVNTLDVGLSIGATYNIGNFIIQGRYTLGLTDINKFENPKPSDYKAVRNNVFQVGVGYRF